MLSLTLVWGCSSTQSTTAWGNFFTNEDKVEITLDHLKPKISLGKKLASDSLLRYAKTRLHFIEQRYKSVKAKEWLAEIDSFYTAYYTYYDELIKNAKAKNFIFTTAGYYKRLQKMFPNDPNALRFFRENKQNIEKRYETNLRIGKKYLRQKRYNSAIRVYRRILNYDPNNNEAIEGIAEARYLKKKQILKKRRQIARAKRRKALEKQRQLALKRAAKKKEAAIKELEEKEPVIQVQTKREAEVLYVKGVQAYRKKRFLDAKIHFESIINADYKDTRLYIDRIEDKIQALGLEGGDED